MYDSKTSNKDHSRIDQFIFIDLQMVALLTGVIPRSQLSIISDKMEVCLKYRKHISTDKRMDFFTVIGSFGWWQLRVFLFFTCLNVVAVWQNFSIIFLAPNMDFSCVQPSTPYQSNGSDDRCWVPQDPNSSVLAPCTRWEYNTSKTSHTIVSEWDLVCEREWLVSLTKSVYMIGFLFSGIVFGQTSDSIGRYPTLLICYVVTCISMFLSLLSGSFTMFIILRFLQAFGRAGATTVGFVLIMELVGPKHQTEVGIFIQLGWTVGYVTLVGIAWFFRHWFWLQLIISLSFLPFALFFTLIPESPRWLLTRGKNGKARKTPDESCHHQQKGCHRRHQRTDKVRKLIGERSKRNSECTGGVEDA
ncbi:solute carrier family 22 member 2 [Caerostris extrusa]|uniref:Solute carrier family 22 member 2 n=1 Tax=Caerostris extrusa TaxID=172846 RepID=A0AAV4X2G7_CAEEX|nr:solute carrier family 22 member 2 [Caerostris extrusa]